MKVQPSIIRAAPVTKTLMEKTPIQKYAEYVAAQTPLIHAQGNVLDLAEDGQFDIVVQGCNCFNTMGGGIAREIRERYPIIAKIDGQTQRGDSTKLGNWTAGMATDSVMIINAYTQYDMSTGEDVFEYAAFELILKKLAHLYPGKRYGFPYIGMGLAMGDKTRIIALLQSFARKITSTGGTATLVEFK